MFKTVTFFRETVLPLLPPLPRRHPPLAATSFSSQPLLTHRCPSLHLLIATAAPPYYHHSRSNRYPFLLPPTLATTAAPPCSLPNCRSNCCPLFPAIISLYPAALPSSRAPLLLSPAYATAAAPNAEALAASSRRQSRSSPRPPAAASSSPPASPHLLPSAIIASTVAT
ncbi:hypothetical protein BHM03_00037455 [Ensete ventricosum]|nr:hypothetical protein BHM03_00037455 [Ensete ventricosum]